MIHNINTKKKIEDLLEKLNISSEQLEKMSQFYINENSFQPEMRLTIDEDIYVFPLELSKE